MNRGGSAARKALLRLAPRVSIIGLVLVAVTLISLPAGADLDWTGKEVRGIEFRPDTQYDTGRLGEIVTVAIGKPLTLADVQQSIRNLFAMGDFRDVRVDAVSRDDRIALTFVLSIHYRVGSIVFDGLVSDRDRAGREVAIRLEEVLSLNAVDRSAGAIQRMLGRRGWLESSVDPEVRFNRRENRADVIFHVDPGVRSTIERVDFEGELGPFQKEALARRTRLAVNEPYDRQRVHEAVGRLTDFLVKNGRRMADVRFLGEDGDREKHSVVVHFQVVAGPSVRVEVEGVERRTLRKLLPFRGDEPYSPDELERSRVKILTELQSRGNYFATVDISEEDREDEHVVTYHVEPGAKVSLDHVRFDGPSAIAPGRLQDVIETGQGGVVAGFLSMLARRTTGVTTEALTRDRDALETFYRLEGFADVKVGRPVVNRNGSRIDVVFSIIEGPQTIVSSAGVEGTDEISKRRLPDLRLAAGLPLNPQSTVDDVVALKTFYAREGFVNVDVKPSISFSEDRTSAEIIYGVTEGNRYRIGEILVRGNTFTKDGIALRKSRLKAGEPFSFLRLLAAQQNLYRLGIFQRVDLEPRPSPATLSDRDVVISVEEGKALTVAGSLGYSTEDGFRGTGSISHRNLFGTGRYLGLDSTLSQRVNRYALTWREPFLFRWDFPTQVTFFRREELRVNEDAKIKSLGTFVEATRLQQDARWSIRYEYRFVECVVQSEGDLCDLATGDLPIEGLPREDQEIRISSLTPSVFWDRRDDPLNPTKGFYAGGSLEYAFPLLSAKTTFAKGYVHGSWYMPLSDRSRVVLAGRVGLIEPLKADGAGSVIPFAERFTAGGETTNRAFDLDLLGVPCDTLIPDPASIPDDVPAETPCSDLAGRSDINFIAVGGNALVLLNAELRFPLYGDSFRGALFLDAGNVWSRIGRVDPTDLRWGLGAGLRYLTPVGPLRLDFAYKLDRKPFEDPWATFLTLGYAF